MIQLLLMLFTGVLYRLGGIGKPYATWMRDWGISATYTVWLIFRTPIGYNPDYLWAYILSFIAMGGALTTYWDRLFGYDNFWMHGLMIGLAIFPLGICGAVSWSTVIIRGIYCGFMMGMVHYILEYWKLKDRDTWDEGFRGVVCMAL